VNTSAECRSLLQKRADALRLVREFFKSKAVIEVDCPALSFSAPIDSHIDVMKVDTGCGVGYLHTSPEYGMKKLLSRGSGDIYQLSHVFRAGEIGRLHHPEFTMLEWYRLGFSFQQMIDETLETIRLLLPGLSANQICYRDLFQERLGIDPLMASSKELFEFAKEKGCDLSCDAKNWDKDTLLQLLLSVFVEPHLGYDHLFVLTHFPESQAALAKVDKEDKVAMRFEVYYQGVELANGYEELTDPQEQKRRLEASNKARVSDGKEPLPLDKELIEALEKGLPACSGVALGFDRLLQLSLQGQALASVLPLSLHPSLNDRVSSSHVE